MPERTIQIVADRAALAQAAADVFVGEAVRAVAARGRFTVALAGGSTPKALYSRLAARYRDAVPWHAVEFFWGDERHVPPQHPDSNFLAAREAMLDYVPVSDQHVHRIHAELPVAAAAANDYEATLRRQFTLQAAERPVFDLALLGMGADGHTASLFPGSDALREADRLVLAPWVEQLNTYRITMSMPVLSRAAIIVFLVSGQSKAETLRDVLEGPRQPDRLPAQAVQPAGGRLLWLVDRAAASRLARVTG